MARASRTRRRDPPPSVFPEPPAEPTSLSAWANIFAELPRTLTLAAAATAVAVPALLRNLRRLPPSASISFFPCFFIPSSCSPSSIRNQGPPGFCQAAGARSCPLGLPSAWCISTGNSVRTDPRGLGKRTTAWSQKCASPSRRSRADADANNLETDRFRRVVPPKNRDVYTAAGSASSSSKLALFSYRFNGESVSALGTKVPKLRRLI
jgi:hypothetical protein